MQVHALYVEDNEVNRLLAKSTFKKIGWNLETAADGFQMLEKLRSEKYDIIFMDIQLPGMDGYEATLKIRTEFKPPISNIPIIACTAETESSLVKGCIDKGMNDYISKPFKTAELIDKVKKWVKVGLQEIQREPTEIVPTAEVVLPTKTDNGAVINLTNLYKLSGNNKTTGAHIINVFLKGAPDQLANFLSFFREKNWLELQRISHKMKSSYAVMGALSVKGILEKIEDDCKGAKIDESKISSLIEEFVKINTEVINKLQAEIGK